MPFFAVRTAQLPPCAFAIASTIARPSPTPPLRACARRVRSSEALEDVRERVRAGYPQPSSATSITIAVPRRGLELDRVRDLRVLTAFSSSASSAIRSASGSTRSVPRGSGPSRHARGATSDQRMNTSSRYGSRSTSSTNDEVGLVGLREQEQPLEDLLDSAELVERHVDFVSGVPVRALQHLEMAAGDRDRRAQLVRDVVEKPLLPLEQRSAFVRLALDLPSASWRRRACQTMARNIADISGTSNSSPQSCVAGERVAQDQAPVEAATRASTSQVRRGGPRPGTRRGGSG